MKLQDFLFNIRVYDNEGKTADRYTVVLKGYEHWDVDKERDMISLSSDPSSPNFGVDQYSKGFDGEHLGKRVKFSNLPKKVQLAVKQRMELE